MHTDPSFLQALWFILIGVLWAGYFVLEGFDFGVGMLVRGLGSDDVEKRMIIHTIGPVWDGNEVWLIVAGGATFAAFPGWYATAFSGFYLALFLVLAALIVRGVSFEFWGKVPSARWRGGWEWALAISSGAAALLFGVAWANFVWGVPMGPDHVIHASLLDLLHPYALLGGVVTLTVFLTHGALFLSLRTTSDLRARAERVAQRAFFVAAVATVGFLVWTVGHHGVDVGTVVPAVLTVALFASVLPAARRSGGLAFGLSAGAIVGFVATLAACLWPNAVISTTNRAFDLTLAGASSSHYTLVVMTVVAVIFVPIVLAYQSWTYWVFRHRLGRDDYEGSLTPLAVLDSRRQKPDSAVGPSHAGAPPHGA
ncbi:MAG TPA: cytochrome d ubiquinol oxidase subunit II [Solirubrobacteraceae bacterium]|nr:cytochrome d ubiquinol oxidase subunit II [Solirubrobacteraceae bacterium]